jgi:zinc D-Ala-D-Ala carboxypeptidase
MSKDIPVAQRLNLGKKPPVKQISKKGTVVFHLKAQIKRSLLAWKFLQSLPWWSYALAISAFLAPIVILGSSAINFKPRPEPKLAKPEVKPPEVNPETNLAGLKSELGIKSRPNLFGHFAYSEAPESSLQAIAVADDGYEIKLRRNAAQYFLEMVAAAKAEGIELSVISAFRTIAIQKQLFFDIGKERNQTPAQRAKVSAPPGYSEHHTGYAVDIGDRGNPSTNLSQSFDRTLAFRWLTKNAAKYGYELSFAPNNPQGVMYEPWHWRFVGDSESLATFYRNSKGR